MMVMITTRHDLVSESSFVVLCALYICDDLMNYV